MAIKPELIERIRYLSQEEGMRDDEIAKIIHEHRGSVCRIRSKYQIPKANILKRRDVKVVCNKCSGIYFISREDNKNQAFGLNMCKKCLKEVNDEIEANLNQG